MSTSKYLLIIFILLSFQISCNSDDDTSKTLEPEVFTLNAMIGSNGGVNLSGNYLSNGNSISEQGFEFSEDSLFYSSTILNTEPASTNEIEYFLANGIEEGEKYFYKAFVKTSGDSFYGNTKSFISDGSVAPEIKSLSEDFGHIADTIEIYGNYFKDDNYQTFLDFSEIEAEIIILNDTIITSKVPSNIKHIKNDLRVSIGSREGLYSFFSLFEPKITSVTPINATFGDELTITGDHFDFEINRNKVYFGNVEATITYADRNTLKVIVPNDLESSSEPIKVMAQLQEVEFDEHFKLIPPEISSIPQEVYTNQDIIIEGANFHPILQKNKVTIENIDVDLTSGDTQNLGTKIPLGPFPRRKAVVKIQLLDLSLEYEVELSILDKWIMVSDDLPFWFERSINNAVVANNQAYVIAPNLDFPNYKIYLWKFNKNDYTWVPSEIPFPLRSGSVSISNQNKVYVYDAGSDNGFWEFDPITEQWSQLAAYPGARRDFATHFSIDEDIYIGMGADFEPYSRIEYGDFYKYSPSTDSWTRIADFTYQNYFLRTETSTFTINNIAYVGNGASNTGMFDFWSYHPNTDKWIRIADFNDARKYTASFELNGFGYITGGNTVSGGNKKDSWRYDPSQNTWTQVEDIGHIPRSMHFSFSLEGKAYIGGGGIYSGYHSGYDFYEFIP